jgi:hypothetical protein
MLTQSNVVTIVANVCNGDSLIDISKKYRIGNYKFAKIILEALLGKNIQVSHFLGNPSLIKENRIQLELLELIGTDQFCSHDIDQLKECLGKEYEELLIELLNQKQMCFETESDLRNRGKPKTPDILFLIPMAMNCKTFNTIDGQNEQEQLLIKNRSLVIINWIDSKAMFADVSTFEEHVDQFRTYNNRYGRGLVIYWHGYVDEVESIAKHDFQDFLIVTDHFPDYWVFPTGEIADGTIPEFDNVVC